MFNSGMYDLIIIGSGPAGFTASIYASRYMLKNLVLGDKVGGTIGMASKVCNFPGFTEISGLDLMAKIEEQVKGLGAEVFYDAAVGIKKIEGGFEVVTKSGKNYQAKTVILATGTERRRLEVPGEKEYLGKGVSYCTTCDAPFFKDKVVAVAGGADAACTGAIYLAEMAKKVYIVYRKEKLRAEPVWVKQIEGNAKIEPVYNANIIKILGAKEFDSAAGEVVGGVELDNPYKGEKILRVDGVFVEIGGVPGTGLAASLEVELDEVGFVKVNEKMETNILGVFSAGDCNSTLPGFAQVITAAAEGAVAAASVYKFLKQEAAPQIRGV
jgi:thioredoxin reductase (NADPH)